MGSSILISVMSNVAVSARAHLPICSSAALLLGQILLHGYTSVIAQHCVA